MSCPNELTSRRVASGSPAAPAASQQSAPILLLTLVVAANGGPETKSLGAGRLTVVRVAIARVPTGLTWSRLSQRRVRHLDAFSPTAAPPAAVRTPVTTLASP
jgi:hypothetical protein